MAISKWKLKAVVQKGISFLPNNERINYFFQKYVTKGVQLTDEHFGYKIEHARDHIEYFKKYGEVGPEKSILELGTGWYPIVPLFMYLTKTGKVISLDIQSWMTKESQLTAIRKLLDWKSQGKVDPFFRELDAKRLAQLVEIQQNPEQYTLDSINQIIGLTPMLQDARKTDLASGSLDFICSNNTFEHIYGEVLSDILKEFQRIIKPNGVMSHFIDLSDHFAHFDHSINIYNFLQFSEKAWRKIDNSIQPQSRLRWPDYQRMYRDLDIPITEESIRPGDLNLLNQVNVHAMYDHFTREALAISHGYMVSKMSV